DVFELYVAFVARWQEAVREGRFRDSGRCFVSCQRKGSVVWLGVKRYFSAPPSQRRKRSLKRPHLSAPAGALPSALFWWEKRRVHHPAKNQQMWIFCFLLVYR
ncbi:unnamed protein product, partial [Hapterophycus canaliculatus]